jgi:hypothetical protein
MALSIKQSIDMFCDEYSSKIDAITQDFGAAKEFVEYMNRIPHPKKPVLILSDGESRVYYRRGGNVLETDFQRRYS